MNVGSLQALGAADNLEFNSLSLVEGAIAVRLDGGEVDEDVLAALALKPLPALNHFTVPCSFTDVFLFK